MFEQLIKLLNEDSIVITDEAIIKKAFIHRSYLNESKDKLLESNERLEFLGDSVLSLIVSHYLYVTYPTIPEGQLTNYRSSIVKTGTLAVAAKEMGLGTYLHMARGESESGGKENPSLLADTFEALLGVIYLNFGFEKARIFVQNRLLIHLEEIITSGTFRDYKSIFQERVQEKYRISPQYTVVSTSGPDHAKEFEVQVQVELKIYGNGHGKSKQEAEQAAAKAALDAWPQS
ncbi:MAG: ribonuclease III [bacterium]|nr:ribonuclease III [bacterium]